MGRLNVILFTSSAGFPAVSYNFSKLERGDAELIYTSGFGILDYFQMPRAKDYENYFLAQASLNTKSQNNQFHAVISAKGRSLDCSGLKDIAVEWVAKMGYSHQPVLIFFHKDSDNNHVHIVSTDVKANRLKISDSFDRVRAIDILNKICGIDDRAELNAILSKAQHLKLTGLSSLSALLKLKGYSCFHHKDYYYIKKSGKTLIKLLYSSALNKLINHKLPKEYAQRISLILQKESLLHSAEPSPVFRQIAHKNRRKITSYRSDLSEALLKHGLQMIYHFNALGVSSFTLYDQKAQRLISSSELYALPVLQMQTTQKSQLKR